MSVVEQFIDRLRVDNKIVGFHKKIGKSCYYSRDKMWWNGRPIAFDLIDKGMGIKDKNSQWIFENDLIKYDENSELIHVIYDELLNRFLGVSYSSGKVVCDNLRGKILPNKAKIISYFFIQKDKSK